VCNNKTHKRYLQTAETQLLSKINSYVQLEAPFASNTKDDVVLT